jgi:hypothetical protein
MRLNDYFSHLLFPIHLPRDSIATLMPKRRWHAHGHWHVHMLSSKAALIHWPRPLFPSVLIYDALFADGVWKNA